MSHHITLNHSKTMKEALLKVENQAMDRLKGIGDNVKPDTGLFYKSQFHHCHGLKAERLETIKKTIKQLQILKAKTEQEKKDIREIATEEEIKEVEELDIEEKERIEKTEMNHLSGIMEYLNRLNHQSDSSIYDDIKSRSKLPSIVLDQQIRPDIFSKKVTGGIKRNQQINVNEIITNFRIQHSLSELFADSKSVESTFLPLKDDPLQIQVLKSPKGDQLSINVEYFSWKKQYYMMIKYSKKNSFGYVEHKMKIMNFKHDFNFKAYNAEQSKKKKLENKDEKEEPEAGKDGKPEILEDVYIQEKTKMGKLIFETQFHTYSGHKEGSRPDNGTVQSHNNLTMKYGQWIFFYKIHTDFEKNTETVQLCRINLEVTKQGAKLEPSVDKDYLNSINQTISVITLPKKEEAPVEEDPKKKNKKVLGKQASGFMASIKEVGSKILHIGENKAAEAVEVVAAEVLEEKKKDEPFEDLEIVATDCIVFASNSKFHGDKTIPVTYSEEEATKWFQQQYVVLVGQTESQKLVLSVRRTSDLEKSIVAVQSKGNTKTLNDVVLAYHKGVKLHSEEEETAQESDYFGLYANDLDDTHVFKINPQPEIAEAKEEEPAPVQEENQIQTSINHEESIVTEPLATEEEKDKDESAPEVPPQDEEASAPNAAEEAVNDEGKQGAVDDEDKPKPELENIILDSSKDQETIDLFARLLQKVKSSNYGIYDFRKNYSRTYLYKQYLEKELDSMLGELRILEDKRKQQINQHKDEAGHVVDDYEIIGHNIIFVENESVNQEQNMTPIKNFRYILQIIGKNPKGLEIMFYSSHIQRNQKYRVMEDFNPKNESSMVKAIVANHGGEVRQINSAWNNVFLAGNGKVIFGQEAIEGIEGGKMFLPREIWKFGRKDLMDEYIKKNENKAQVLGLECFELEGENSSRIHHFHQDRNVSVRMQRYHEKGPKDQQMIELEVWDTRRYELENHLKGKDRSQFQLCREVVQSTFVNLHNLENFGNLCHSSSVQLDGLDFKQRYQILCRLEMSEEDESKHKRYVIYEYELNWNDEESTFYDPENPGETTRLKLVGQKTLLLNGEDTLSEPYLVPYYASGHHTLISGTQILDAGGKNSISLPNFDSTDFQFKTGVANTGYKIYVDTNDDQDWKCLLIESQLNTHDILNYEDETEQARRENARTGLTNEDLRRLYEQQLRVVLNMVPFDQLKTTYRWDSVDEKVRKTHESFDHSKQDKLAPLEVLGSNSIIDYLLHQPVEVDKCFGNSEEQPSLVELYIRNQEEIRGDKAGTANGETRKFEEQINQVFGEGSFWQRGKNEIWQDLLQSNPIMRAYDNDDMSLPSISASKLTKVLNNQGAGAQSYEMMMMILPTILETDDIDVSEYANFFIDAPESNNFGMRLEGKQQFKGQARDLPKYSAEELTVQALPTDGRNVDLDQRAYAKRFLVHNNDLEQNYATEFEQAKLEGKLRFGKLPKKAAKVEPGAEFLPAEEDEFEYEGGTKNINVKHYLINFQSISYINRIRCIQGIRESDDLDVTEFEMADYMLKINQKFADYCDQAPIIRNIIDQKFEATKQFFLISLLIYVFFFVVPFLTQIFYTHGTKNYLVVWVCVGMCQVTQCGFLYLEYQQIMQDGFAKYITDFDNKNDLMTCLTFPIYTFMRIIYTNNMLPSGTDEVNLIYAYFLFSNCIFILNIAFKIFKFMKTDSKFGLLVQLVSTAVGDCINFTVFMFIWIAVFSLLYRILGSYNSNQSQNFPNLDDVSTFLLQTFENSLGNISNPTYGLWSSKLGCKENTVGGDCDQKHVGVITHQTYWISKLSIYLIWVVWFANQFLILIILLNFLISVISKSYSDVMDSALMFKYVQMCELNREFAILNEQIFSKEQIKCLILTANNDDDDGNADFGGLVSQIKDYIKGENRSLNKFIHEQRTEVEKHVTIKNKAIEENLGNSKQEIKEKISELNNEMQEGIKKVQADVSEMQQQLDGSVQTRRKEMNTDITLMHQDMKQFFTEIRSTMEEDMATFKDQISDVKKGVEVARVALNEDLKNVESGVKAGIDGVQKQVADVDNSVNVVSSKVADVHQGVNAVKEDTLAEFSKVKNSVGDVSNNLKSVESGVNSKISGVQASVQAVDSSVSKVQQGVSDVNKDLKEVDAKANAQDEAAENQAQAKEDIEKLQQVQADLEEQLADEKVARESEVEQLQNKLSQYLEILKENNIDDPNAGGGGYGGY